MSSAAGTAGKLDIGGVFEATTDLWKDTFGTVWIVALILLVPAGIINGLLGNQGGFLQLIGSLVQLVASVWLAGTIVRIVENAETGGRLDASIGELFGSVTSKIVSLILLGIVMGILIGIGFVLLIIPGVILILMWIVSVPSMVVEDRGVFDSMSRSSDLTRDNRMRVLGVGILLIAAYIVIAIVVAIFSAITPILGIIAGIVVAVLLYPWISIVLAVLYFRLRDVKGEGVVATPGPEDGLEPPAPVV